MSVNVGLDVGTGGARAVAVDEAGTVVAEASSDQPERLNEVSTARTTYQ